MANRLADVVLPLDDGPEIKHHAGAVHAVGLLDAVGDLGEFPFVECFGDQNQSACVARQYLRVESSDGRNAHQTDPRLVFAENAEQLFLLYMGRKCVGCRALWQRDAESVVAGFDGEQVDVASRRSQGPVEITRRVVERIETAVQPRTGVQQFDFTSACWAA